MENDFVFSVRGTMGKYAIIPKEFKNSNITANLMRISPNQEKIKSNFLKYIFDSPKFLYEMDIRSPKTTIRTIKSTDLKDIPIPVPPFVEQRGIIEVLVTVDECIRLTDEVIGRAEKLKRGLMQRLLTRGIGHTEFKDTPLGKIPKTWEIKNLGILAKEIYRYPTYYNIEYQNDGIPEVRGELIKENGEIETDLSKYRYISVETSNRFPRTILKEDDFVFTVRGTMGKYSIIPKILEGSNITANLMRISPNKEKIIPKYLKQVFNSSRFIHEIEIRSPKTTIRTIKSTDLKDIPIKVPPVGEQKRIAEVLNQVDEFIRIKHERVSAFNSLKQGLMQVLLSGKIRIELQGGGLHRIE